MAVPCRTDAPYKIDDSDRLTAQDAGGKVLTPQIYVDFLKRRTGTHFGTVRVPSPLEKPHVLGMLVVTLISLAYVGWQVYTSSWIGHPAIWATACVSVFLFAASGAGDYPCFAQSFYGAANV